MIVGVGDVEPSGGVAEATRLVEVSFGNWAVRVASLRGASNGRDLARGRIEPADAVIVGVGHEDRRAVAILSARRRIGDAERMLEAGGIAATIAVAELE